MASNTMSDSSKCRQNYSASDVDDQPLLLISVMSATLLPVNEISLSHLSLQQIYIANIFKEFIRNHLLTELEDNSCRLTPLPDIIEHNGTATPQCL